MGDPERLLSVTSGVDEVERELLVSIRDVGPPGRAKGEAWHGIAAQLATATLVGAAHASATGSASSGVGALAPGASAAIESAVAGGIKAGVGAAVPKALATKFLVVLAVSGAGVGTAAVWLNEPVSGNDSAKQTVIEQRAVVSPTPRAEPPAPERAPATSNCGGPGDELPACTPAPSANRAISANQTSPANRPPEARPVERLSAESRLVTEARAELRNGNISAAKAALDRLHAEFPKGVLTQEREVLTIELLSASGDSAKAARRAQAFIKRYPKSPHSAKLGRFLEKP